MLNDRRFTIIYFYQGTYNGLAAPPPPREKQYSPSLTGKLNNRINREKNKLIVLLLSDISVFWKHMSH